MKKRNKYLKVGRPLLYGEQTFVFSGFHCPISRKKEMQDHVNNKLKEWEANRETAI